MQMAHPRAKKPRIRQESPLHVPLACDQACNQTAAFGGSMPSTTGALDSNT